MFSLYVEKNLISILRKEPVTSGSVNVYPVHYEFSPDWDGLTRTAVFRAGDRQISVPLPESGECTIPKEVLRKPQIQLYAGVYGCKGAEIILPTQWAYLGTVLPGAAPGQDDQPPYDLVALEQALEGKGDALGYTPEGELGLYSGDKLLSAVPVAEGGGEGGVSDHRLLSHRGAEEQHPIQAISGLQAELDRIPEPVEALTNFELEELLA